jgi:hypothetical protein
VGDRLKERTVKGLGLPQLLVMFAVVLIIAVLFNSGIIGGPRE